MGIIEKIEHKEAIVGVVGLGYVGLPLAAAFCRAGFHVVGFDVDNEKIISLREGKSYISYINLANIDNFANMFTPTSDFTKLSGADCIIICLPTPLTANREPDMKYVFNFAQVLAKHLCRGQLVVLESTTYPGTTDEDLRNILETSGLKAGEDFYLAYSPEREDPNNPEFSTTTIPKVVGGYTQRCLTVSLALYSAIIGKVVPVSSARVAESSKLLENIYRSVNIALVNELKVLFDRMGIDIWEVVEAAKTKPFGFQAFYPGPGLGGHCIPIDPFYLTWKAREYDFNTRFIELAGEINTYMPYFVVEKTVDSLNKKGVTIKDAKILILGLAYKKNVSDVRESPSLKLIELLLAKGAKVNYNDPFVPTFPKTRKYNFEMSSIKLTGETLKEYDCVLISTDHSEYDYCFIVEHSNLIIDTRNATAGLRGAHIVKA